MVLFAFLEELYSSIVVTYWKPASISFIASLVVVMNMKSSAISYRAYNFIYNLKTKGLLTFMPEVKWTTFSDINPEREYCAFANVGERKSVWTFFSAMMRARKMTQQLKTTKGVIGVTGRLGFLNRGIAIVGVFENEDVLNEFAHSGQHAKCMEETKAMLKVMKTIKWSILGSSLPPTIDDAISRANAK